MTSDPFRPLRREYLEGARARLGELPALAAAAAEGDAAALADLRRLAHQLRGSGGFYGFHAITAAAAALEELVIAAQSGEPAAAGALAGAAASLAAAVQAACLP